MPAVDGEGFAQLVRPFRYAIERESIEVVNGAIDEGEEPLDAARRELQEELGIEAGEMLDLGPLDADTSQVLSPSRLFLARELKFSEPNPEGTEGPQTLQAQVSTKPSAWSWTAR